MRAIAIIQLGLLASLLSSTFCVPPPVVVAESRDDKRREAERLWEQAIAAKGGRERLHAVHNFVVTSKSSYKWSPRPDVATGISEESLYVLPGKWWSFWDYRPGKMGYGVDVLDFESQVGWISSQGQPAVRIGRADLFDDFKYRFRQAQFVYLMETEQVKPSLIRARTGRINLKKVDVVETVIDGARVDFYLSRETHLPLRIVTGTTPGARASGKMNYTIDLGDYVEIEGIRMPHRVYRGDAANKTSYRFNANYSEAIFEHPPSSEMGPNAWREREK